MKGMLAAVDVVTSKVGGRRGMESGIFGLTVAEVGKGGKERISGVRPGMRSATTFWIILTFLEMLEYQWMRFVRPKKRLTYFDTKPIWWWCICKEV